MRVYPNPSRKKFLKNGGKSADEIDGAHPEAEGIFVLGNDGDGQRLGRFRFDEVLDIEHGLEAPLFLHRMLKTPISNPYDGGVTEAPPAMAVVVVGFWQKSEEKIHGGLLSSHCVFTKR